MAVSNALFAEFDSADRLAQAVGELKARGYKELDAFTPFPSQKVERALGDRPSPLSRCVLVFGVFGAAIGYGTMWYTQVVDYPLNVGGHRLHPIPAFIPITFELGVLFAALASFFGFLGLCRLPRLWDPMFEASGFERVSIDRYWLVVSATDPLFETSSTRAHLKELAPVRIGAVPSIVQDRGNS